MNIRQISALAEIMKRQGLSVLEICEGELKIRMERSACAVPAASAGENTEQFLVPVPSGTADFNEVHLVKSPMVGVFYAASSPENEPFVKIGSKVKKGDVLCIIEAMKLMNDIQADRDGEIADICVHNGDVVEFGQTLFKLF